MKSEKEQGKMHIIPAFLEYFKKDYEKLLL